MSYRDVTDEIERDTASRRNAAAVAEAERAEILLAAARRESSPDADKAAFIERAAIELMGAQMQWGPPLDCDDCDAEKTRNERAAWRARCAEDSALGAHALRAALYPTEVE